MQPLVVLRGKPELGVAFLLSANPDRIYLGHTVAIYPGDPLATTPVDSSFTVLVGSQAESCIALALHDDATRKVNAAPVATIADIVAGHQANPITLRVPFGLSQDVADVRRVLLLPPTVSGPLLTNNPRGYLDQAQFYDQLLSVIVDQGDPIVLALWEPVIDWWRAACTDPDTIGVSTIAVGDPVAAAAVENWKYKTLLSLKQRGHGSHGAVTAAHLMTGISDLRQTLVDTNTDRMVFDRDRAVKTLEDKHGAELTKVILRLCGVADEAGLPPVHRLLAFGPKAAGYGIIASLVGARIQSRCVPMDPTGAPLVTPSLLSNVFRSYQPGGGGLEFGVGLTPFAIVCKGHADMHAVEAKIKKATIMEEGATVTLADASIMVQSDVRLPQEPYVAVDKLYGWSIMVDIFHGENHPVAQSIRACVNRLGPGLPRIITQYASTRLEGMNFVHRIMYELQQDYFGYLDRVILPNSHPPVPTFDRIVDGASSFRASSFAEIPTTWALYGAVSRRDLLAATTPRAKAAVSASSPSPSPKAPATSASNQVVNPYADPGLVLRRKSSGHPTITAMMAGTPAVCPQHGGKDLCLSWCLNGQCNSGCKRKDMHKKLTTGTVQELHKFLDDCGVPAQASA